MSVSTTQSSPQILWLNAIIIIGTPLVAVIWAPFHIMRHGVHWSEPLAMVALWWMTGLGITIGYHRLWSHKAFQAKAPVRLVLAILGAASWQNTIIEWSSDHRRHHRHTDQPDDPYNATRGFWWSHVGWILIAGKYDGDLSNVHDLKDDPICSWQHRNYLLISTVFNVGIPVALGLATGRVLSMLLWAGLLRIIVAHHATFFINSLAHIWGSQPYSNATTARDNPILAFFTLGEGYHNYHHTFQADYRNGVRWFQWDPSKWIIWTLSKIGLAFDLKRVPLDHRLKRRYQFISRAMLSDVEERLADADKRLQASFAEFRQKRLEAKQHASAITRQARIELRGAQRSLERAFKEWLRATQVA